MNFYEEKQNEFFTDKHKKYGYSHKSLCWESPYTQNARFVELLKMFTFVDLGETISILDYGCGLAHLYGFLKDNGFLSKFRINYTGVDINENFVKEANLKYPGINVRIKDETIFNEEFDFVFCSGLYNLKFSPEFDIYAHFKSDLKKLYDISRYGVGVNFQSKNAVPLIPKKFVDEEMKRFYFHDEKVVLGHLKEISKDLKVSNGYLPHDFTIYLMKMI